MGEGRHLKVPHKNRRSPPRRWSRDHVRPGPVLLSLFIKEIPHRGISALRPAGRLFLRVLYLPRPLYFAVFTRFIVRAFKPCTLDREPARAIAILPSLCSSSCINIISFMIPAGDSNHCLTKFPSNQMAAMRLFLPQRLSSFFHLVIASTKFILQTSARNSHMES